MASKSLPQQTGWKVLWVRACPWWKVKLWNYPGHPVWPYVPRFRGLDIGRLRIVRVSPGRGDSA